MKIGILTWYDAINHGAVLQAYATYTLLRNKGHEVYMLEYHRCVKKDRSLKSALVKIKRKVVQSNRRMDHIWASFDSEKVSIFQQFKKETFTTVPYKNVENLDSVIIGSDMVFCLVSGYNPYMFGIGVPAKNIFSYAASSGGSTYVDAQRMNVSSEIAESLSKFSGLGYRDADTAKFLTEVTGRKDLTENIDPVLLYGFESEQNEWNDGNWKNHVPYLLIYSYNDHMDSKAEIECIRAFASGRNMQVVSCGYFHDWCDSNVNASPKEFVCMFKNAAYVITDTFHGTVFSIICRKEFASAIRSNSFKLRYLLNQYNLADRIFARPQDIETVLKNRCDYSKYDQQIEIDRSHSEAYIHNNLYAMDGRKARGECKLQVRN